MSSDDRKPRTVRHYTPVRDALARHRLNRPVNPRLVATLEALTERSGVYIVVVNGAPRYVGQSNNLRRRIVASFADVFNRFGARAQRYDTFEIWIAETDEPIAGEAWAIAYFKPTINRVDMSYALRSDFRPLSFDRFDVFTGSGIDPYPVMFRT